jgi:hypothetical protein
VISPGTGPEILVTLLTAVLLIFVWPQQIPLGAVLLGSRSLS